MGARAAPDPERRRAHDASAHARYHPTLTHLDGYELSPAARVTRDTFATGPAQRVDLDLHATGDAGSGEYSSGDDHLLNLLQGLGAPPLYLAR